MKVRCRHGEDDSGTKRSGHIASCSKGLGCYERDVAVGLPDRKSTRLNSSHGYISYAVFCLKKKKNNQLHSFVARQQITPTAALWATRPPLGAAQQPELLHYRCCALSQASTLLIS